MIKQNDWPLKPLKNLTTKIGSGATPKGGKNTYLSEGISLIRSLNVYDFMFKYSDLAFISTEQAKGLLNVKVQMNDILLNITGASVARCCIVPSKVLPARVNQHVSIIRVDPEIANPQFYLNVLNSPMYKHQLLTLAQGGATREALTKETIENFLVPFPPLQTQHIIAGILSAYDDLIENNIRRIQILEEMAQTIYREWFVHYRFPGHENVRMVDSGTDFGEIPEGWETKTLDSVCDYIGRGISPKYDDNAENIVINQRCIRNNRIDLDFARNNSKSVSEIKKIKFGDVLINSTGVGTLGRLAQVYINLQNCTVDSHVSIVRPNTNIDIDFFGQTLINNQSYFESLGVGSTGQTELNRGRIQESNIISPPIGLQQDFSKQVKPMQQLIINLLNRNNILRNSRDLLLPKLISGEIDVSDLQITVIEE